LEDATPFTLSGPTDETMNTLRSRMKPTTDGFSANGARAGRIETKIAIFLTDRNDPHVVPGQMPAATTIAFDHRSSGRSDAFHRETASARSGCA